MNFLRRISTIEEFRQTLKSVGGYTVVACIPKRANAAVFDWLARRRFAKVSRRIRGEADEVAATIKSVLQQHVPEAMISEIAADYYEMRLEDDWMRWQASHSPEVSITTEVENIHHLEAARERGRGAVLWGTSFCETLFQKIALAQAGVSLTQLSSYDHGRSHHGTLVGRRVAQPLFFLPEDRYLNERIVIPNGKDRTYLYRIGDVLKKNGCIWMACHGSQHSRHLDVTILGQSAKLPAGAPTIAMRYGAALIPTHTERCGRFHYRVTLSPPMEFDSSLKRRDRVQSCVQSYADMLGAALLKQPGSWNWLDAPDACGLA